VAKLGWLVPETAPDGVRYVESVDGETISYPKDGFDAFGKSGGSGFWFEHRAEAVRRKVKCLGISSMWEVGAGTGAMAHRLLGTLTDVATVEPLPAGARVAAELGLTALCGTLQDLQLPDESLESIGLFDVLEHVEHPEPLVDEVHRVLRPAGLVIATVPAFRALWGNEDDAAGHYRRYTKSTLAAEFETRGFASLGTEYLYASLVPAAGLLRALPYRLGRRSSKEVVLRSIQNQLTTRRTIDRFARAVLSVEQAVAKVVPLPFGLTVLGVFRKR
jgi:SAM-dependent methyltransferase